MPQVMISMEDFLEYQKLKQQKQKHYDAVRKYMSSDKGKEANKRAVKRYREKKYCENV